MDKTDPFNYIQGHPERSRMGDIPDTFNAGATLGPVNETNMAKIWNKHRQSNTPLNRKVFVGLSGGVDSSVSAALLKRATPNNFSKIFGRPTPKGFRGYDVTGVFIKVWSPPFLECSWKDDRLDAMRVCAKLGIPFRTLDLEKEYKWKVVDYMIAEYKAGRTPNPDVMCNKYIKFGAFFDWAEKEGADYVATGHYARVSSDETREARNPKHEIRNKTENLNFKSYNLLAGSDQQKDQSYFLWTLTQRQLVKTLFPVGGMDKPEVRRFAKKFGLITADKKDSQGLCFLGKIDMKDFLARYLPKKCGKVLNEKSEVIGEHDGAHFFTLGERRGFNVIQKTPNDKAYYIVARDVKKNTITVAHRPILRKVGEVRREVLIKEVNWINAPPPPPPRGGGGGGGLVPSRSRSLPRATLAMPYYPR